MSPLLPPDPKAAPLPEPPPAFTPRLKKDPPGMSALFVAVTLVCALGAGSILATTPDGINVAGLTGVLDGLLASTSRAPGPDAADDHTGSITAVQLDPRPLRPTAHSLAIAVRDHARATGREIVRVDSAITAITGEVSALRQDVSSMQNLVSEVLSRHPQADADAAVAPLRRQIADLAARLSATDGEVEGLRSTSRILYSSIDRMTSAHVREIDAINRRIGKVEDVISLRADVTSAIPTRVVAPLPRKRAPRQATWTAEEVAQGTYLLRGPTGTFEVKDGSHVPGLGRIAVIRNGEGQLRLLTGKDAAAVHP